MNFLAEMELLSRIRWQFFGSLTYRQPFLRKHEGGKADRVRLCRWHAFGRDVAENLFYTEKHWSKIIWALRLEQGEHGENCWHNHFLMSGLPNGTVNPGSCEAMKALWRQTGGGHPSVRVYEARLNGAEYVAKCMSLADLYEARKFGDAPHLTLSSSFWRVVQAQDLVAARRLAKLEKNTQERLADGAGVSTDDASSLNPDHAASESGRLGVRCSRQL